MLAFGQTRVPVRDVFDYLLFGVSDLDHGIDRVERRTGVRAMMGGVQPEGGTRKTLISLGGPINRRSLRRIEGSWQRTASFSSAGSRSHGLSTLRSGRMISALLLPLRKGQVCTRSVLGMARGVRPPEH